MIHPPGLHHPVRSAVFRLRIWPDAGPDKTVRLVIQIRATPAREKERQRPDSF